MGHEVEMNVVDTTEQTKLNNQAKRLIDVAERMDDRGNFDTEQNALMQSIANSLLAISISLEQISSSVDGLHLLEIGKIR